MLCELLDVCDAIEKSVEPQNFDHSLNLARMSRRAAGRLTRSKSLVKRSHSGGQWPGKKLNNFGEDLGKTSYL